LFVIHELHQEGLSISAIARRTGLSRKTVRKYLQQGLKVPRYGPRAPRPQLLDPFRAYLREQVETYPRLRGNDLHRGESVRKRRLGHAGMARSQWAAGLRLLSRVSQPMRHRQALVAQEVELKSFD
jgi:transposase-like protein